MILLVIMCRLKTLTDLCLLKKEVKVKNTSVKLV